VELFDPPGAAETLEVEEALDAREVAESVFEVESA
jgi:hypothetical protein